MILPYEERRAGMWTCLKCNRDFTAGLFGELAVHPCVALSDAGASYVAAKLEAGKKDLKPDAPTSTSPKPPMHALPLDRLGGLSRALDYGDRKYAPRNWIDTAKDPRLYIGAALRHLSAIQRGEMYDPESGLPHVNHMQACAVILEEALRNSGALLTNYE